MAAEMKCVLDFFCRWSAIEALKLATVYINQTYLFTKNKNMLYYPKIIAGLSPSAAGATSTATLVQNRALLRKAEAHVETHNNRPYGYAAFTQKD